MDLTWVSDQRGWALAAVPCVRGLCPRVTATGDGGRTWTALPPAALLQESPVAVTEPARDGAASCTEMTGGFARDHRGEHRTHSDRRNPAVRRQLVPAHVNVPFIGLILTFGGASG
jgi:hypothetical protein